MPKDTVPITRTEEEHPFQGYKETHPAFGMIVMSRISCSPPQTLFGSAVKHSHFIKLSIRRAVRTTDLYHEWFFGKQQLIEVFISGSQLSELLTSMNVGDGVPCTLAYYDGEMVTGIPPTPTLKEESQAQLKAKLKEVMEDHQKMLNRMEEMLQTGLTKKADREAFKGYINKMKNDVGSNLTFAGTCFDEKVEKMVAHAKGEVEAFISNKITSAGLQALGGTAPIQINFDKEEYDEEV